MAANDNTKIIAVSAATFSGNQGAASMLHATIQQISALDKNVRFAVFTVYPEADRALNSYKNVTVYSATPRRLVISLIPASFAYRFLPFLRPLLARISGVSSLADSSLQIDLAGISFADGRRVFLIYNIASVLPALLLRVPVIKFSQAMGPFNDWLNRLVARFSLKRLRHIFARGRETRAGLDRLGLHNVSDASDIAFLFQPEVTDKTAAQALLHQHKLEKKRYMIVAPSRVLFKKAEAAGIDYVDVMARYIDWLIGQYRLPVVLIAHSIREDTTKLHNNDLPVCQQIYEAVSDSAHCILPQKPLYAGELKALIGEARLVVAARFHAMISSLSTATPVVVTGWSHKYQEVLDSFGVSVPAVYLDEHFLTGMQQVTKQAVDSEADISKQLQAAKPGIIKRSKLQVDYVKENYLK